MTATFLLPFAVGACAAVGGNIAEDAFGVVAMVAMTPLIAIQILGLVYKIKQARASTEEVVADAVHTDEDGQVIMTFDTVDNTDSEQQTVAAADADEEIIDF
jgi:hypothetical protein